MYVFSQQRNTVVPSAFLYVIIMYVKHLFLPYIFVSAAVLYPYYIG